MKEKAKTANKQQQNTQDTISATHVPVSDAPQRNNQPLSLVEGAQAAPTESLRVWEWTPSSRMDAVRTTHTVQNRNLS